MQPHARVLIADDDPQLLSTVAEALTQLGADVTRAASGAELIDALASGPFDLVITDVSMPWMNGLKAMRTARAAGVGTAVIVMTALQDKTLAGKVRALGRNAALLRKPFALSELESTATRILPRES
jgi:DNA-binding response OmpR family regulator